MSISSIGSGPSAQQLQQFQAQFFKKADANNDGSLTLDEFKDVGKNLPGGKSAPAGAPKIEDIFKQIDSDGDGKVSKSELSAFKPKFSPQNAQALLDQQGQSGGSIVDLFNTQNDTGDQTKTQTKSDTASSLLQSLINSYKQADKQKVSNSASTVAFA